MIKRCVKRCLYKIVGTIFDVLAHLTAHVGQIICSQYFDDMEDDW